MYIDNCNFNTAGMNKLKIAVMRFENLQYYKYNNSVLANFYTLVLI